MGLYFLELLKDEHKKNIRQRKSRWRLQKIWQKGIRKDAEKIKTHRECFWIKYPEIFNKNEVEMVTEVATTMETESRSIIDREKKLRKVEARELMRGLPIMMV